MWTFQQDNSVLCLKSNSQFCALLSLDHNPRGTKELPAWYGSKQRVQKGCEWNLNSWEGGDHSEKCKQCIITPTAPFSLLHLHFPIPRRPSSRVLSLLFYLAFVDTIQQLQQQAAFAAVDGILRITGDRVVWTF